MSHAVQYLDSHQGLLDARAMGEKQNILVMWLCWWEMISAYLFLYFINCLLIFWWFSWTGKRFVKQTHCPGAGSVLALSLHQFFVLHFCTQEYSMANMPTAACLLLLEDLKSLCIQECIISPNFLSHLCSSFKAQPLKVAWGTALEKKYFLSSVSLTCFSLKISKCS